MSVVKRINTNINRFKARLQKAWQLRKKASETATRVEAFRLSRLLKEEIRQGAPGGRPFSPLTEMAKRLRRPANRTPLRRLAVPIRYAAIRAAGKYRVSIGFVDPGRGRPLSKSWKRIAKIHQEGFTQALTEQKRMGIIHVGARLTRRVRNRFYLFLRKSTQRLRTPARPIIDPFWKAHRRQAERNIERNFERKLRGERI